LQNQKLYGKVLDSKHTLVKTAIDKKPASDFHCAGFVTAGFVSNRQIVKPTANL